MKFPCLFMLSLWLNGIEVVKIRFLTLLMLL